MTGTPPPPAAAPERCPEALEREAMTDDEFWEHVLQPRPGNDFEPDGPDLDVQVGREPCPECGEPGACAWDTEGRALIHVTTEES